MKRLLVLCTSLVLSCNLMESDKVKPFIPGTYFKRVQNEFNSGLDTLVITVLSEKLYRIARYSKFTKIIEGQSTPPKRHAELWTAVYDEKAHVLNEINKGKVISFIPDKNKLLVGSSEYKKINK